MQLHPVARVYAEALLAIARERGMIDAIGAQLTTAAAGLGTDADVRRFFAAPTIDLAAKKRVLLAALGQLDATLVDFLCLLLERRRIAGLDAIARAYAALADEAANRKRVWAASAVALPADLRQRLEALLRDKLQAECILETDVQPELIGGLVLRVDDTVYDGSVRRQLQRIGQELTRSSGYED
jgi:F-type H+-transporting ATPase subunit delta